MVCLYCNGNLAVSNSRPQSSRNQTWRRRLCKVCGAVFTSTETIDLSQALVVQDMGQNSPTHANQHQIMGTTKTTKNIGLRPFDRDRLFMSLYESLRHRPTAAYDARGLTDTVISYIIKDTRAQISPKSSLCTDTHAIAETILDTLKHFDQAAATHYAAFHRRST